MVRRWTPYGKVLKQSAEAAVKSKSIHLTQFAAIGSVVVFRVRYVRGTNILRGRKRGVWGYS